LADEIVDERHLLLAEVLLDLRLLDDLELVAIRDAPVLRGVLFDSPHERGAERVREQLGPDLRALWKEGRVAEDVGDDRDLCRNVRLEPGRTLSTALEWLAHLTPSNRLQNYKTL